MGRRSARTLGPGVAHQRCEDGGVGARMLRHEPRDRGVVAKQFLAPFFGGGELRLVVASPNSLVFEYNPPMQPSNPRLTAADAALFADMLKK